LFISWVILESFARARNKLYMNMAPSSGSLYRCH